MDESVRLCANAVCDNPVVGRRTDAIYCSKVCTTQAARHRAAPKQHRRRCRYRRCGRLLAFRAPDKRGPAPEFCDRTCRRRERSEREREGIA